MKSKHGCVAGVGVALVAFSASWIGCGGTSSSSDPTTADSGIITTPSEAGSVDSGSTDSGTQGQDSSVLDASISGPFIDLQFGNCPAVVACGGDPVGSWKVTGGCVDDTIFDPAKAQCAGLTATNVAFKARGTVVADATTIKRTTETKYTATFGVPKACKDANPLAGNPPKCADLDTALTVGAGLQSAKCKDAAGGGCDCDVGDTTNDATSDAYTTSGNVLTTGAGNSARTYDYCVSGNDIKYKETTAKTALPASFTLTK